MSAITKSVVLSGGSPNSIEEAISGVLARAAETISDIVTFTVRSIEGTVDASGLPADYHVTLEITFVVKEPTTHP